MKNKGRKSFTTDVLLETLLQLSNKGCDDFMTFFSEYCKDHGIDKISIQKKKKSVFVADLTKAFKEMSDDQFVAIWSNFKTISYQAIEYLTEARNSSSQADLPRCLDLLEAMCVICLASLEVDPTLDDFILVIVILHGCLLDFEKHSHNLASNIAVLCFEYWSNDSNNDVDICSNTLIFFLNLILQNNFSSKDANFTAAIAFKYMCSMKEVLPVLLAEKKKVSEDEENEENSSNEEAHSIREDLDLDTVQELSELIMACSSNAHVLANPHGRKFFAAAFVTVDENLMKKIHNHLASFLTIHPSHFNMEHLGQLYQLSWMLADDDIKPKFEDYCVQDVMYRSVRTPRGRSHNHKSPFTSMQTLLKTMFRHKTSVQLIHMVARLYDPFIWRALQAANAVVRANALTLLFDVFPLRLEALSVIKQEEFLINQVKSISNCLLDPNPQVRTIAVTGVFKMFNLFWNILHSCNLAKIFQDLYGKLAFDVSSDEVRESVLTGSTLLLSNPASHELLKKILPSINACINDASEKVRLAFGELLLKVQTISTIMFWDVCPVEKIFRQIEHDRPAVCKRLNSLLIPSFFPKGKSFGVWVQRCIHFYTKTPTGARKFYFHVATDYDITSIGNLIKSINRFVFHNVRKSILKAKSNAPGEDDDDDEEDDDKMEEDQEAGEKENTATVVVDDPDTIAGLLETIAILWPSYLKRVKASTRGGEVPEEEIEINKELVKLTLNELSKTVRICLKSFSTNRMHHVLIELASVLDPSIIKSFSRTVIPKLRSLPQTAPRAYYSMLIRCASRWKWGNQVLELILDWLDASYTAATASKTDKRRSKKPGASSSRKKRVAFAEIPNESRPEQALRYLTCFIEDMDVSSNKVKVSTDLLLSICKCLYRAIVECSARVSGNDEEQSLKSWTDKMLIDALYLHLHILGDCYIITSRKGNKAGSGDVKKAEEILKDIEQVLDLVIEKLVTNQNHFDITMNASTLAGCGASAGGSWKDPGMLLKSISLSRSCVEVVLNNLLNLIRCNVPITKQCLHFLLPLMECRTQLDKHIRLFTCLFHEVLQSHVLFDWTMKDEVPPPPSSPPQHDGQQQQPPQLVNCEEILTIFQQILDTLALFARNSPDSFQSLMKDEVRKKLRLSIKFVYDLCKDSKKVNLFYKLISSKVLYSVISDLAEVEKNSSTTTADEVMTLTSVDDLPLFSGNFLPILCSTVGEVEYILSDCLPNVMKDMVESGEGDNAAATIHSRADVARALVELLTNIVKPTDNGDAASKPSKGKKHVLGKTVDLSTTTTV